VLLLTTSLQSASECRNLAEQALEGLGKVDFLVAKLENEPVRYEG
jgi:hypothetical protein